MHKVRHLLENKLYALKIVQIKPNQLKESVEDYLYKLLSEAKTLAALHHPNVVSYNGCWIELRRFMPEELLQEPLQDTDDANEFEMVLLNEDSSDSSGFEFASHSDRPTHNSSAGKDTEYTQGHTSTPQLPNSSLKYLK